MAGTGDAVLIGFIITVTLIGIGGGVSLGVFICVKWRECLKRNRIPVAPSRQPTRRNRRIRVHNATPQQTRRNSGEPFCQQTIKEYLPSLMHNTESCT
jgi:hypothetical protein